MSRRILPTRSAGALALVAAVLLPHAFSVALASDMDTPAVADLKVESRITLTLTPNPAEETDDVTLTARIAEVPGNPVPASGTVEFRSDSSTLVTAPLTDGVATGLLRFPVGVYDVTVQYAGDSVYREATSDPARLIVLGMPLYTPTTTPATPTTSPPRLAEPPPRQHAPPDEGSGASPEQDDSPAVTLPFTGIRVHPGVLLSIAAAILAAGLVLVVVSRRRRGE